jgi:hypothetical protein
VSSRGLPVTQANIQRSEDRGPTRCLDRSASLRAVDVLGEFFGAAACLGTVRS